MAGAFMGCVVNIGRVETPVQIEPHRDVKESVFGVSCLCPFGDYTQGGFILCSEGNFDSVKPKYSNIRCQIVDLPNRMSP